MGTLDGWKQNAAFFDKEGMELYQLVTCVGFGSVLMHDAPMHGALLHLHSKESGLGKTTATKVALGIWGNPEKLILEKDDTVNFKMLRAEIYNSLPFVVDEITNMPPKVASDFVYAIPNGKQKGRMSGGGNTERTRSGEWRFLAISTGNTSIVNIINLGKSDPQAESARALEARVDRYFTSTDQKLLTDDFAKSVHSHYGHAGIIFLQHYMKNKEHYAEIARRVQERVDRAAGLASAHRFWSEYITRCLTAAIIARKLQLIDYDMERLFKFCVDLLKTNKTAAEDMGTTASQIVSDFFSEHYGNVLWIKSTSDLRGTDGLDSIIIPEINPRSKLVARYETDTKMAYILVKPFKAWCSEQQIDYGACVAELIETMGAKKRKMRITKGTHMNLAATDTIVVPFNGVDAPDEHSA